MEREWKKEWISIKEPKEDTRERDAERKEKETESGRPK